MGGKFPCYIPTVPLCHGQGKGKADDERRKYDDTTTRHKLASRVDVRIVIYR
jgi:hypothetical protein